jgi:signal transduction histidine kinase
VAICSRGSGCLDYTQGTASHSGHKRGRFCGQGDQQGHAVGQKADTMSDKSPAEDSPHENADRKAVSSTDRTGRDELAKSLQHEIRTPLQGALLTTELVLEDISHGDPVSEQDIRSIRKSIESAVKILNDFARR